MTARRVVTLVLVVAFLALFGMAAYAWSNGLRAYAVESDSMSPAIKTGDIVVDLPTNSNTVYQVGDIVTFHPPPGVTTTHRIAAITQNGYVTKGDANQTPDVGYVQAGNIVGRVATVVPYAGAVIMFFQHPASIALLALLLVGLFVAWELSARRPSAEDASPPVVEHYPERPR